MPSSKRSYLASVLLLMLLCGCATYEAVVAAPPGFWLTLESLVWAVCQDIWTVVEWVL